MAQSDQSVQNATFPSVRADINDNLAALYSQSSGNSAPAVTVAFQPWVDTSSSPPVWKVRNGSNSAWITVGVLDPAGFNSGGITAIANGGTGATTAAAALAAFLPSQTGNAGKALVTSGTLASWGVVASGASIQTFTGSGTYTPTAGKTTFLVFATGGGGGGGNTTTMTSCGTGGGGGGTALRFYNTTEMGISASITVGGGGGGSSAGGSTIFTPIGTGLAITGAGGSGGTSTNSVGVAGGGTTNSVFDISGGRGGSSSSVGTGNIRGSGGTSFFAGGAGGGGLGATGTGGSGGFGGSGVVLILEW